MTQEQLLDALDRLRGRGAEFSGFLANHGPMGAEALVTIGAGDQTPQARLPRSRPEEPVTGAGISGEVGRVTRVDGSPQPSTHMGRRTARTPLSLS